MTSSDEGRLLLAAAVGRTNLMLESTPRVSGNVLLTRIERPSATRIQSGSS